MIPSAWGRKDITVRMNLPRYRTLLKISQGTANAIFDMWRRAFQMTSPSVPSECIFTMCTYYFCHLKGYNQEKKAIGYFLHRIDNKSLPVFSDPRQAHCSNAKLRSAVICGMLHMQAGGRGSGKNLWGCTHTSLTPLCYLLPGVSALTMDEVESRRLTTFI